ncbi:MAG: phosphate ABC transporter permease subunit PstC [Treponema sp.]|jgi:phosphate transport system permease protein|nr:phosphate ABC transporter permease subunit PstC [Treponema sp.]
MNRKQADVFFKHLFGIVSLFSVLALGAILLFVFVQGLIPFAGSTAGGIQIVPQNIDEITINGKVYRDQSLIEMPRDTDRIALGFAAGGWGDDEDYGEEYAEETAESVTEPPAMETLELRVHGKKAGEQTLLFTLNPRGEVTSPERGVSTVTWPAIIDAMSQKIHFILPEGPLSPFSFLGGLQWRPVRDKLFGVFPMIAGTVLASLGAIALGVPAALLCAVFMAEFLSPRAAALCRSGIELLAGIPSVVYGFFGLMVIVPAVKAAFRVPAGNTLLSAIIVLALMILPTVITIAETSIRAVPPDLREAALALGASKMQTAWGVALPHAQSGVIAGIILGISRAVGETMAVILVAGNSPQLTLNPLESVRTLTATIAMEMGYASGRHSEILFSIGVVLFVIILALNSLILRFRREVEAA